MQRAAPLAVEYAEGDAFFVLQQRIADAAKKELSLIQELEVFITHSPYPAR